MAQLREMVEMQCSCNRILTHGACDLLPIKLLRDCGIVVAEPEGRQNRYEIADPHLTAALEKLVSVTLAVDESAGCLDPSCPVPGCCEASA